MVLGPVLSTVMTVTASEDAADDLVWETTLFARPRPTRWADKEKAVAKKRNKVASLPVIEPNAAGIDVGATEIFVAVPGDRDAEPVRSFPTFTVDLERLADWLQQCQIRTVAMESTGVLLCIL